jgi:hypothetical protein
MIFPSIFAISAGLMMIGWWSFSYRSGLIPELDSEPIRIRFHLAGEFATAVLLVAGGIGLLIGQEWGSWIFLVANGMLLYTVIVSPGYALQNGERMTAVILGVFLVLSLISIAIVI